MVKNASVWNVTQIRTLGNHASTYARHLLLRHHFQMPKETYLQTFLFYLTVAIVSIVHLQQNQVLFRQLLIGNLTLPTVHKTLFARTVVAVLKTNVKTRRIYHMSVNVQKHSLGYFATRNVQRNVKTTGLAFFMTRLKNVSVRETILGRSVR